MVAKLVALKPWKDVVKTPVPDKGLQKALTDYKRVPQEKKLLAITAIGKIVNDLKTSKEVKAVPAASKYLLEVAASLQAERLEIQKANADVTLEATIENGSDDVFLTVEDLNKGRDRIIVDRQRLNKKQTMDVTLFADGSGKGQVKWIAEQADDAASRREEIAKGIKEGERIKVRV